MKRSKALRKLAILLSVATFSASVRAQTSSLSDVEQAANQGDVGAQVALGRMYYDGIGIPVDREKAMQWNQKAADQGSPEAMLLLAAAYTDDDTSLKQQFKPDFRHQKQTELTKEAREKAHDRASKGDPAAMYVVARADELDKTGTLNDITNRSNSARRTYRQAAEKGYTPAEVMMVSIENYEHPRNLPLQLAWAKKAAEHGASDGMLDMGLIYKDMRDAANAKTWIIRAAELNNLNAINVACERYHIRIGNNPGTTYPTCGGIPMDPPFTRDGGPTAAQVIGGVLAFSAILGLIGPRASPEVIEQKHRATNSVNAANAKRACFADRSAFPDSLGWVSCETMPSD